MKIIFYDTHSFEREVFIQLNLPYRFQLQFVDCRLVTETAGLASGSDVVCSFANDKVDADAIAVLSKLGVKLIALRSAGYNHVDLNAAKKNNLPVVRVPEYSPYSVAEHAVALMLCLNRKVHRSYQRVRELNFSLEGLTGFDFHGKTVGIVGTGRIGSVVARIMNGFGCKILAHDLAVNPGLTEKFDVKYVGFEELIKSSKIISLHVPLTPETFHMIGDDQISRMQDGVMLINTGRGGLVDTKALINGLKNKKIGSLGIDVYEEEGNIFFHDLSSDILQDEVLARLLTFPNAIVTSHQGFLTEEALNNIAKTTLENIYSFQTGKTLINQIQN